MNLDGLKQSLVDILYKDTSSLRIALGWSALTLSFGFVYGATDQHSFNYLNALMHYNFWALSFGIYGFCMMISGLVNVSRYAYCIADAIGLWLWTYLFLSFVVIDPIPTSAAEYMLVVPILMAVWVIVDRLFKIYIYDHILTLERE